jgi:hypothetical protein
MLHHQRLDRPIPTLVYSSLLLYNCPMSIFSLSVFRALETYRVSVYVFGPITPKINTTHLVHAWLIYHHRYGVAGLKGLAQQKFAQELDLHLDSPDFPEACQEAYESTFHTDRGLRDMIIQAFRSNPGLSSRQDVEMVVRETPGLAFELYRMASGMPIAS